MNPKTNAAIDPHQVKRETLQALIVKWRDEADGVTAMGYSQQGDRMRDCADELEMAIASPVSSPRVETETPYTAEQFAADYAARSRTTVEALARAGRGVRPCHCGAKACRGWQMVNVAEWDEDNPQPSSEPAQDGATWEPVVTHLDGNPYQPPAQDGARETVDGKERLEALKYWYLCEAHQPEIWEAAKDECPLCEANDMHREITRLTSLLAQAEQERDQAGRIVSSQMAAIDLLTPALAKATARAGQAEAESARLVARLAGALSPKADA